MGRWSEAGILENGRRSDANSANTSEKDRLDRYGTRRQRTAFHPFVVLCIVEVELFCVAASCFSSSPVDFS